MNHLHNFPLLYGSYITLNNYSKIAKDHTQQYNIDNHSGVILVRNIFDFLKPSHFIKAPFIVLQQVLYHLPQLDQHTLDNGNHTSLQGLLGEPLASLSGKSVLSVTSSFLFSMNTFICPHSKYTWDCSLGTMKTILHCPWAPITVDKKSTVKPRSWLIIPSPIKTREHCSLEN